MDKKKKENKFKQLISTPRGRAVLFFGAYLVFFLALMLLARLGGTSNRLDTDYENGSSYNYSFSKIEKNNYEFSYEIMIDSTLYSYKGKKNDDKILFTYNNFEYFSNDDIYLLNQNDIWLNTENPYVQEEFLDVENLKKFLKKATYVSKTEYESGKTVYSYMLASASITKIFENSDLDIEEIPNEIIISVDEDNFVDEVKFKLDSYCKVKEICTSNMIITLKYDEFGNVSEITNPLE